jgi:cytochrome b561
MQPNRYSKGLVILHWVLALLLFGALMAGTFVLDATPNSDPDKRISFIMHMSIGVTILALMVLRLYVRLSRPQPAPFDSGSPARDGFARAVHWALYALAIAVAVSGIALSVTSGLPDALFGEGTLPADFSDYPARAAHGILTKVLAALIVLHVAAALWHGLVRRDGIFARMRLRG